jgi:hypothetical protein
MHSMKNFGAGSGNRTGPPRASLEQCTNFALNAGTTTAVGGLDYTISTFGAAGGRTTQVLPGHAALTGA